MFIYRAIKTNHETQGFGIENTQPGMLAAYKALGLVAHNGLDWACTFKEPIYWCFETPGTVTWTQDDLTAGVGCEIITETDAGAFKTQFWHFVMEGLVVKIGDTVQPGDLIGYGDSTGMSTGNHLHFGLKPQLKDAQGNYYTPNKDNGYAGCIDPTPYFKNEFILVVLNIEKQISVIRQILNALKQLLLIKVN
jgi:hypothetical protein